MDSNWAVIIILVGLVLFVYIARYAWPSYYQPAKSVTYKKKTAKKFLIRTRGGKYSLWSSFVPLRLYLTDHGLWMGTFVKIFYPYSEIQSARKGNKYCMVMIQGLPCIFQISPAQKNEFFDSLEEKGIETKQWP